MNKLLRSKSAHAVFRAAILGVISILISSVALISLPATAIGAETDRDSKALERQENLDFFYNTLKAKHPNPFSVTPQSEFDAKVKALYETAGDMDNFTFMINLQSIMSLVGDSHTTVSLSLDSMHFYGFGIDYYENVPALIAVPREYESLLGKEVTAINEMPLAEVYKRFSVFASHDNEIRLQRQFKQMSYVAEILAYIGISEPGSDITVTVMDSKPVKISLTPQSYEETFGNNNVTVLDDRRVKIPVTEFNRDKYYFSMPLNDSAYYIQYNFCAQDPELPMDEFTANVRKDLDAGNYSMALVDLRYNSGGSDGVIFPLINLLAEKQRSSGIKIFCLTDEITFSSAVINAIMMKEMGAISVGAPTGGSVDHFGSTSRFSLPNSRIRIVISSKMIEMRTYFESGNEYGIETLKPDYNAEETLDDYLNGIDTTVQYVLEYGNELELPENNNAKLTRGSFAALLYQKAKEHGKGNESGLTEFRDVFPFARNTPAIEWAYNAGLVSGINREQFAPANLVTQGEIAEILASFAEYMEQTPTWKWQDFSEGNNISRQQGKDLIDALFP